MTLTNAEIYAMLRHGIQSAFSNREDMEIIWARIRQNALIISLCAYSMGDYEIAEIYVPFY